VLSKDRSFLLRFYPVVLIIAFKMGINNENFWSYFLWNLDYSQFYIRVNEYLIITIPASIIGEMAFHGSGKYEDNQHRLYIILTFILIIILSASLLGINPISISSYSFSVVFLFSVIGFAITILCLFQFIKNSKVGLATYTILSISLGFLCLSYFMIPSEGGITAYPPTTSFTLFNSGFSSTLYCLIFLICKLDIPRFKIISLITHFISYVGSNSMLGIVFMICFWKPFSQLLLNQIGEITYIYYVLFTIIPMVLISIILFILSFFDINWNIQFSDFDVKEILQLKLN